MDTCRWPQRDNIMSSAFIDSADMVLCSYFLLTKVSHATGLSADLLTWLLSGPTLVLIRLAKPPDTHAGGHSNAAGEWSVIKCDASATDGASAEVALEADFNKLSAFKGTSIVQLGPMSSSTISTANLYLSPVVLQSFRHYCWLRVERKDMACMYIVSSVKTI